MVDEAVRMMESAVVARKVRHASKELDVGVSQHIQQASVMRKDDLKLLLRRRSETAEEEQKAANIGEEEEEKVTCGLEISIKCENDEVETQPMVHQMKDDDEDMPLARAATPKVKKRKGGWPKGKPRKPRVAISPTNEERPLSRPTQGQAFESTTSGQTQPYVCPECRPPRWFVGADAAAKHALEHGHSRVRRAHRAAKPKVKEQSNR